MNTVKEIKYTPFCDQTISHFKKKTIIAIVKEKESLSNPDFINEFSLDLFFGYLKKFKISNDLGTNIIESFCTLHSIEESHFRKFYKKYETSFLEFRSFLMSQNKFINIENWIKDNYDEDFLIVTNIETLEDYRFFYDCDAFIIEVINNKKANNPSNLPDLKAPYKLFISKKVRIEKELINKINTYIKKVHNINKPSLKRKRILKN